ncbi:SDR family NAD(P)-dependent oxidoreductase [Novosphingobium piscinae]|uniref:SDR family oxidoreductase n=1 Tax=Novosphingobium piscinae TaxID=1507448 RepID=A0A7X1FZM4_9SPHN|nr:SDR family NAD(P)-dependent oxidoreductase [Novosphingobium piscinae]MBC2669292.1 SDR family oxidoreductase [Novosphingobium piscinae]
MAVASGPADQRFAGQRVLITGAAGLLGRALARAFAKAGASLALVDLDAAGLDRIAGDLPGQGTTLYPTDLRDAAAVSALPETVQQDGKLPTIVINNAGIAPFHDILAVRNEDWEAVMQLNLRAPFIVMREFGRAMIACGVTGAFVNVSSGAAAIVRTDSVPYGTSKAGLEWMSAGFAAALGPYGIRVNCVRPGLAVSDDHSNLPPNHIESASRRNPMRRIMIPQDLAKTVLFLASDDASYVTGQVMGVNGGSNLPVWVTA